MPVLTRTQFRLATRQMSSGQVRTGSSDSVDDYLSVVDEECEHPQKAMSYPSTPLGRVFLGETLPGLLTITPFDKVGLHQRYMSDEEETSPSPDSETGSSTGLTDDEDEVDQIADEVELKHKVTGQCIEETIELQDYKAEIAIAVPIMAMGPPKLVDITNIAPMRKRARTAQPTLARSTLIKNAVARKPLPLEKENHKPIDPNLPACAVLGETTHLYHSKESLPNSLPAESLPDSWLSSDNGAPLTILEEPEVDGDELFFPRLELSAPPTYDDYDPYQLHPPSLSPRGSTNPEKSLSNQTNTSIRKQAGSIARTRKQPISPSIASNVSWRGLTRSLSMAKRQEGAYPSTQQQRDAKKLKMLGRGATGREPVPLIPPFPFEAKTDKLTDSKCS